MTLINVISSTLLLSLYIGQYCSIEAEAGLDAEEEVEVVFDSEAEWLDYLATAGLDLQQPAPKAGQNKGTNVTCQRWTSRQYNTINTKKAA